MHITTPSVIAVAGLLLAAAAGAQPADTAGTPSAVEVEKPPRYAVEVLVFSYAEEIGTGTEVFTPRPVIPLFEQAPADTEADDREPAVAASAEMTADSAAEGPEKEAEDAPEEPVEELPRRVFPFSYVSLLPEQLTLEDAYTTLDLLDAYQPLMHFGWIQPTVAEDQTPALALERFGDVPAGLDGTFKLFLSRYLHLAVDVSLAASAEEAPDAGYADGVAVFADDRVRNTDVFGAVAPQGAPLRYRLSERRIMKNGDVRYFDHPRFGVIARVARIEEDETAESGLP